MIHGLADAVRAMEFGRSLCLLSAPGAVRVGGVLWWRAVIARARESAPGVDVADVLDCGTAPGLAMGALRAGQRCLVLAPSVAAWPRVAAAAAGLGSVVLARAPDALDMAGRDAVRRLPAHLGARGPS